jgi:hypothetical protein
VRLPACLTEHRPLIEWNGHAPARYVEVILVGVGAYETATIARWQLGVIAMRRRVWLRRSDMEFLVGCGTMRATVLREADELPLSS